MTFDYAQMDQEERPFARRLATWIVNTLPGDVVDLGAGSGVYVEELRRQGVRARGYDIADPQPRPDLVTTSSMLDVIDPAQIVLCLEVAEHIPHELSIAVVESIMRNTMPGGYAIFSAAQPGQGGVGHINCQPPGFWAILADRAGFVQVPDMTNSLHKWITSGYHMGWFAQNRQLWYRPRVV